MYSYNIKIQITWKLFWLFSDLSENPGISRNRNQIWVAVEEGNAEFEKKVFQTKTKQFEEKRQKKKKINQNGFESNLK